MLQRWRNWIAGVLTNRRYEYLLKETSALHDFTVAELTRLQAGASTFEATVLPQLANLTAEVKTLRDFATLQLAGMNTEVSRLHSHAVPALEEIGNQVNDLNQRTGAEFSRIADEIKDLQSQTSERIASQIELDVVPLKEEVQSLRSDAFCETDHLRHELSRLHELVTVRLAAQIEQLNEQIYALKHDLYHPDLAEKLNGFNGQFSKHRIFQELCVTFRFDAFVETGSHIGATAALLADLGKPVHTVEADPEFYEIAHARLAGRPNVHLSLEQSPAFLDELTAETLPKGSLIFFYLDAHWGEHLPLVDELRIIAAQHPTAVIMADDFKVEDDEGYGFDSYTGGQEITLSFLKDELQEHGWEIFFPTMRSVRDHMTGDVLAPRGTAVMACRKEIIERLQKVTSLRQWMRPEDAIAGRDVIRDRVSP